MAHSTPFYRAISSPSYCPLLSIPAQISNMTTAHYATQTQMSRFAAFQAGTRSLMNAPRTKLRIEFMRTAGKVVLQIAGLLDETTIADLEREVTYWMNRGE